MKEPSNHESPSENITIEMLEDAMPYVSRQMKRPLEMYMKCMEIKKIMNDFDQPASLNACETNEPSGSIEDMLAAMRRHATGTTAARLDTIRNLMQATRLYKTYTETLNHMSAQNTNTRVSNQKSEENTGTNDFLSTLLPLLLKESSNSSPNNRQMDLINHMKEYLKGADKNESPLAE